MCIIMPISLETRSSSTWSRDATSNLSASPYLVFLQNHSALGRKLWTLYDAFLHMRQMHHRWSPTGAHAIFMWHKIIRYFDRRFQPMKKYKPICFQIYTDMNLVKYGYKILLHPSLACVAFSFFHTTICSNLMCSFILFFFLCHIASISFLCKFLLRGRNIFAYSFGVVLGVMLYFLMNSCLTRP